MSLISVMNPKKFSATEMELAIVDYFNPRINLIVPNISWGLYLHECDLLLITKNNYAYEIEIKVSKSDLKKDLSKSHCHSSDKIKKLFFAIPEYLKDNVNLIPACAGVIVVNKFLKCEMIKDAPCKGHYKFSENEKYAVARLGALRIWGLKSKIISIKKGASHD